MASFDLFWIWTTKLLYVVRMRCFSKTIAAKTTYVYRNYICELHRKYSKIILFNVTKTIYYLSHEIVVSNKWNYFWNNFTEMSSSLFWVLTIWYLTCRLQIKAKILLGQSSKCISLLVFIIQNSNILPKTTPTCSVSHQRLMKSTSPSTAILEIRCLPIKM